MTIAIGSIARLTYATGGALAVETTRHPTLEEAALLYASDDD